MTYDPCSLTADIFCLLDPGCVAKIYDPWPLIDPEPDLFYLLDPDVAALLNGLESVRAVWYGHVILRALDGA